ncbi:MAG: glycosyltransferase family 2 protein [Cytophagales bacterium]|nr:glycosyltransferase family 2 protein [Bernardetiaceae bacterium]MDW8204231.1 glycosyltransferase family 2 protein [Cytophagales bacterium]
MSQTSYPSLAIVILNYNGSNLLTEYLPLVLQHSPSWARIVVADNGSTDCSLQMLQARFPTVELIDLQANHGFAKGYNLALQQVAADYYLLLNSDVEVTPQWVEPLMALISTNRQIFACQPKMLAKRQPQYFEYAGAAGGLVDALGYPFCRGRLFHTTEPDEGQYNQPVSVFWASGACMLVRADLFHQLGGFDDDFFAHMEEIDLCWRAKNAGYRIMYCPESTVYHLGGGTLAYRNPQKTYLNFRNSLMALIKNEAPKKLWFTLFARMCLDGVAGIRFLLQGEWKHLWAVLRAHFYLYAHLRQLKAKRKQAQRHAIGFVHPERWQGSIVWAYFVRGIRQYSQL